MLLSCANQEPVEVKAGTWRKSPTTWLNGAEVYSNVESLKGVGAIEKDKLIYRASTYNFDGPLRWQIVAEGTEGEHVSMRLAGVQITTGASKRSVRLPLSMLGGETAFELEELPKKKRKFSLKKKTKEELEKEAAEAEIQPRWMASYTIPDTLQLFPKADGKVVLAANIVITSSKGTQSEWVNFALLPNANKSKSFTFRQTMIEYGGVPID
ncbi:hypothetical protein [Rubritalea tangerina]|uniref:hypothetical protein n=1 Tax=Rubritalea tangerina TaxID=430798 RepID=UPI0036105CC9